MASIRQNYAWEATAERVPDTVTFLPTNVIMPKTSTVDTASAAAHELIHALANPPPASPLFPVGNDELATLNQLAHIFATQSPAQPPTVAVPTVAAAPVPRVAPRFRHPLWVVARSASLLPGLRTVSTPWESSWRGWIGFKLFGSTCMDKSLHRRYASIYQDWTWWMGRLWSI
jgi:hypothetical protein